jgi:hypothetical protein
MNLKETRCDDDWNNPSVLTAVHIKDLSFITECWPLYTGFKSSQKQGGPPFKLLSLLKG